MYLMKKYPYDLPEATPPQIRENLPRGLVWGSRQHACFLFTLCYWMRGGIDSHTAIRALTRLYEAIPSIFDPGNELLYSSADLPAEFKKVGLGYNASEIASAWRENWRKIVTEWGSDPRNLFKGISTYEEACARIQRRGKSGFKGFQEKMVSMLTYFYMDAGIIDRWHFPVPVDFHVLRIVFSNEIIVAETENASANGFYTKRVLGAIRDLFMWYCREYSVDPLTLCEAIWLYSRMQCSKHPGNISKVGGRQGRKTPVYAAKTWSKSQTRAFERTCGVCPLQNSCRWCIPSAKYYIQGRLERRGYREEPLQSRLVPLIS